MIKIHPHTVVIEDNGEPNTVSIHKVTAALQRREHHVTARTQRRLESDSRTAHDKQKKRTSEMNSQVLMAPSECAADHIIGHKCRGWKRTFVVRRNEHGPKNDMLKLAENITKHFITRYHIQVNKGQPNDQTSVFKEWTSTFMKC